MQISLRKFLSLNEFAIQDYVQFERFSSSDGRGIFNLYTDMKFYQLSIRVLPLRTLPQLYQTFSKIFYATTIQTEGHDKEKTLYT